MWSCEPLVCFFFSRAVLSDPCAHTHVRASVRGSERFVHQKKQKNGRARACVLQSIFGIWLPRPCSPPVSVPGADLCVSEGLKCPLFTLKRFIESFVSPAGHLITIFQERASLKPSSWSLAGFVFFVIAVKWQLYGSLDELGYHPEKTEAKTFPLKPRTSQQHVRIFSSLACAALDHKVCMYQFYFQAPVYSVKLLHVSTRNTRGRCRREFTASGGWRGSPVTYAAL